MTIENKLFDFQGFELIDVREAPDELTIIARSTASQAACPNCGAIAQDVHSVHRRSPRDLPISGHVVRLELDVQRFYCQNPDCPQQTFVERFPLLLLPYAQRTQRLTKSLEKLAFELGGELGSRIAHQQSIGFSPDTMLRICRRMPIEARPTPRVLGIDDWAFRRGHTYGTILIDLEQHCPVDLLPVRTVEAVAAWLQKHPGVEIVSRDRASVYADGISQGAPKAIQIVDRWHILKNIGDALQRLLEQQRPALRAAAKQLSQISDSASPVTSFPTTTLPIPEVVETSSPRQQILFEQIKALATQGDSQRAIARELHIDRVTVVRYLHADQAPAKPTRWQNLSTATSYLPYLQQRWASGCTNARQLWRELQEQGFHGSYHCVARLLKHFRSADGRKTRKAPLVSAVAAYSPRQAMWILVKASPLLTDEQRAYRDALLANCPELAQAYLLTQRFVKIVQQRQVPELSAWCQDVLTSTLTPLKNFVRGLQADYGPVEAALEYEWSNGQTEGQVNRLKYLKRQMYGRASFDLLRRRVLYAA
jgi:transposase